MEHAGLKTILIGVLVRLPVQLGLLFTLTALVRALFLIPLDLSRRGVIYPFLIGLGAGWLFFSLLWKFRLCYVFSHELTHWLTAKVFRRRTGRFRVGFSGGSVEIANPNLWITLSPYFIPLYALIWSALYLLLRRFEPLLAAAIADYAVAGVGVAYAYHLYMTAFAVGREQTDLQIHGVMFSLSLILFCNFFLLFLAVLAVTGQWRMGFAVFWRLMVEQTQTVVSWLNAGRGP